MEPEAKRNGSPERARAGRMTAPDPVPEEFFESPRKRCCGRGLQLALLGLLTSALWAGLLALLLLWHWDTLKNVKQLEVAAAQNVSRISQELQRHQSDQMAQKYQAALMSQTVQELQTEQKQMKSRDSEISWNLDRLQEDLSSVRSQNLNERHTASDALGRLKEEVAKLRMEIQVSEGSTCNTCRAQWVNFQKKCYYFGEGSKRWLQARYACEDLHGRLVSIHSQEEQDFLTRGVNKEDAWIGLRDLDIEGEFIWMDGSPLDYTNWQSGEPNNAENNENCVMMLSSGKWNDAFCHNWLDAWVCEQLATCESPASSDSTDDSLDSGSTQGP